MPEPRSVALTQLALWYDPSRIQIWPRFLALLPDDASAPTPTDLGRRFVTERMTSDRHAVAFDVVRNLPGLEDRGGQLRLRGVGFLERWSDGYRVSSRGRALAGSYAANAAGTGWLRLLVEALLGREPRTRALVKLMSDPGAALVFERDTWFGGSYQRARLERRGEPDIYPLDASAGCRSTLRDILNNDAWWSLGDWRSDPCFDGATGCRFENTRGEPFSLHDIGPAMRAACEALLVGGLLRSRGGVVSLDTTAAAAFLPSRAEDFGWRVVASPLGRLLSLLAEILPALRSPTGHVVASELREELRSRGVDDPDRAIAAAETAGHLAVDAEEYGQSRHGAGLFGDPRKQLVKLRIVGGGVGS